MWRSKPASSIILLLGLLLISTGISVAEDPRYGFGQPATEADINAWDIDIDPSGAGLPLGRGTVQEGAVIYGNKCAVCHGPTGTEGTKDRLVGGHGSLATDHPVKTIGSFWPYGTSLYDYIHRAMPLNAPQSLSPDEVYAVVAWLLHQNGIVPKDAVMDARTLPAVRMPNREGFVADPRPDARPRE
ncbi:MAG: cytochrome c [Nitrospira sp.]|nr:cytochrome c [Nitrospira sp.]